MALKQGWKGRVYEDFEVGDVYQHALGRTVTQTDNIWFTLLTMNPNPIHFDEHYAKQTVFGQPLVDSTFTMALVTGLSVSDISQNAINLGWDEVRLPAPVFEGDTIYAQSEVLSVRESKSRPERGIVQVKTSGYNQDGLTVLTFKRTIMVYKRGHVPETPGPRSIKFRLFNPHTPPLSLLQRARSSLRRAPHNSKIASKVGRYSCSTVRVVASTSSRVMAPQS